MNEKPASPINQGVKLLPFWITAAAYAAGFIFNYILFLAALPDAIVIPSISEILAMLNVSIILIFTTRIYLKILSMIIGYRIMARLILFPYIAWHATWILCIPPAIYSTAIAHYFLCYAKPTVNETIFVGYFLLAAPFASWICIVNYLNKIRER